MRVKVKEFNELSTLDLYRILQLRAAVFIVEQECAYQDVDGKDFQALHVMGGQDEELMAYTRIFPPGTFGRECSIGRVAVSKSARGRGYGKKIMEKSIGVAERKFGQQPISISAQTYLLNFYKDLGFKEEGQEYLEDGIPHIRMVRN